jgi:beta-galactosidase
MRIGVDYYPEHWVCERWPTDARLMQEAGFNTVRLAEFAWVFMEPEEGRFDFALFDDALALLARHGISALMCTPTAAMPAWLAHRYPEALAMKADGKRHVWGVRKDSCYNNPDFLRLSASITRAMAEHFASTPNVIGWQTDNEFDAQECHCPRCQADFRLWLREKHGSLDALNAAWGTHFWGHRYQDWDEIVPPPEVARYNPSLCLDWRRYTSWINVRFQREQVRILREVCPHQFVTHNTMSFHPVLNYHELCADLDFASWDNYPVFGSPEVMYNAAAGADLVRGFKGQNFWIMEQTSGAGGWGLFGRNPRPGEIRLIAYQQVAHGCDGMLWFRWRTCTAGREQYWHGLLGHDGRALRRYREAAQTAGEFHKLWPLLEGTTVKAEVAILYDYDTIWAQAIQPSFQENESFQNALRRHYDPLFRAGVGVDIIPSTRDFAAYKVIVAPELYVLPDALARRLEAFVKGGGVLVTDVRTGVKDETSLCHARTLPGLLSDALGIAIEEYEGLGHMWGADKPANYRVIGKQTIAGEFAAPHYVDWVTPTTAEVLAGYNAPWHMTGFAAVTRNRFGKGWGYYVGTVIKDPAFYDQLMSDALAKAGIELAVRPPAGVEVSVRQGNGRRLLFVLNQTEEEQTIQVPAGKQELLGGATTGNTLTLERFGVAVLALE